MNLPSDNFIIIYAKKYENLKKGMWVQILENFRVNPQDPFSQDYMDELQFALCKGTE